MDIVNPAWITLHELLDETAKALGLDRRAAFDKIRREHVFYEKVLAKTLPPNGGRTVVFGPGKWAFNDWAERAYETGKGTLNRGTGDDEFLIVFSRGKFKRWLEEETNKAHTVLSREEMLRNMLRTAMRGSETPTLKRAGRAACTSTLRRIWAACRRSA